MNLSLLTRVRIFLVSANPVSRLSICTVVCRIHHGTVKICINQKQISSGFYLKKVLNSVNYTLVVLDTLNRQLALTEILIFPMEKRGYVFSQQVL